jgi:predicted phage terminase large subunit-like protein
MSTVPQEVEAERLKLEYRLMLLETQDKARNNFIDFVRYVWPEMVIGEHHRRIASAFDRIANGTLKRLIINLAPRHTKSELASYLLPAFLMGRKSRSQIIQATHTAELAVKFGRKVRDLMEDQRYKELFPTVGLKADSKAAGRWDTNGGGSYFAAGVGGSITGRGADYCVDPEGLVDTPSGKRRAGEIRPGDLLLGAGGYNPVRHVIQSVHLETVVLNDRVRLSRQHPVWTVGRGWVDAADVRPGDTMYAPSLSMYDSSIQQDGGITDEELLSRIQHLGNDASAVSKPERRKLPKLWGAWRKGLRTLGEVFCVFRGHGPRAFFSAYVEPTRQQRGLLPGELRLVGQRGAAEQPTKQRGDRGVWKAKDDSAVGTSYWNDSRHGQASGVCDGHEPRSGFVDSTDVSCETGGRAVSAFRRCGQALRILGRRAKDWWVFKTGGSSRVVGPCKDLWWIPVAVRSARLERHGPRSFVNFHVENSNTFVYESCLTHNCIIDDPHSEQDAMSELALDNAWEWYQSGPRTRLQPGGAVVVVMTRWGTRDLTARLIKAQSSRNADKWEVIEFPAILPSGKPLWPEFWSLEELEAVKSSLSVQKWNAMYQQQPTNDEGAILKREWWRVWPHPEPPIVNYIIQSYDTAYSKKETADYSVITTWGVFYPDQDSGPNIVLLDVRRGRWDFPELKRIAKDEYKRWNPDNVLIEAKATGVTLQQELRRMGIPVTMYTPGGRRSGTDKVSRANSIAPILEAGMVWAPDTDWAEELVEECAAFPNGDNDDMVDSTTQALMRFRQGNFVSLNSDDVGGPNEGAPLVPEYY